MSGATVVLVHGAWCGDWVYWKLAPCLEERGLDWVGADLPTCGATDTSIGPLDDVAHVRDLILSIDGPVVVAGKGKSYGGTVISGATAGCPNVEHLVYIAAMMPEPDELFHRTTAAAQTPEFARESRLLDDGRVAMDPEIGAIQPSAQRAWAKRATHVIERPWDHSPAVSHPTEVAALLADIARAV